MTEFNQLIAVEPDSRDEKWEASFLKSLDTAKFNVLSPDPQHGPDNWPYLLVESSDAGTESIAKLVHWLADKGIGLAVNPMKEYPDYILNYGMIWYGKEAGKFKSDKAGTLNSGTVDFGSSELKVYGNPAPEYFPEYVRKVLRDFFQQQGILRPKLLGLSMDGEHYDIAFSMESLGNPPESEHQGIAEALAWFFPLHYSILITSEKGLPAFFDL